ncbi:hypothetical protein QO179_12455 [Bacillus stercoris]|nr:hypothetical protein [Bacillus stercoris]
MSIDEVLKKLEELAQKVHTLEQSSGETHPFCFCEDGCTGIECREAAFRRFSVSSRSPGCTGAKRDAESWQRILSSCSSEIHIAVSIKENKKDDIEVKIDGKPVPYTINQERMFNVKRFSPLFYWLHFHWYG